MIITVIKSNIFISQSKVIYANKYNFKKKLEQRSSFCLLTNK